MSAINISPIKAAVHLIIIKKKLINTAEGWKDYLLCILEFMKHQMSNFLLHITFCACRDGPRNGAGFFFCMAYNYTSKVNFSKGTWNLKRNLKRKLEVTMYFSIILLSFNLGKKSIPSLLCFVKVFRITGTVA